jgi:phosphohistidine phosphatase
MKTLLLVRHAKSSWDSAVTNDFDRTLNERGKRDAPEMAGKIKQEGLVPDLLISSPAKRALKTAKLFAEVFEISKETIQLIDDLYEPRLEAFQAAVAAIQDSVSVAAVFSHNPVITDFVNTLTDTRVDDMPTCAVFAVQFDGESWQQFAEAEKTFLFFRYPKE